MLILLGEGGEPVVRLVNNLLLEAQQGGWILITALLGDSLEESPFCHACTNRYFVG